MKETIINDEYVEKKLRKVAEDFVNGIENTEFVIDGFCGQDLSKIDMSDLSIENFRRLTYDSKTIFSKEQIEKFHPFDIMQQGKRFDNIEKSDTNEINGRGTTIGIIDRFSNISREQFKGRTITVYRVSEHGVEEVQPNDEGIFLESDNDGNHGNTATSLSVGEECGVAQNANAILFHIDGIGFQEAQDAVLNFIVENGKKGEITIPDMISASANTSIDTKTLDILGELGCEFINSKRFRDYFTWGRINDDNEVVLDKYIEDILSMPSNENSRLEVFKKILGSATMIPVTGRTSSYIDDEGNKVYKYNGSLCGNSFAICQAAGMFLLTRQIDPNIRYDGFVEIVKNQERLNSDGMMYVDTGEIINKVIERSKTKDTQDLGRETISEQQNTQGKDATEQAMDKQIMIRTTNDNVQTL